MNGLQYVAGAAGFLVAYGMYLLFCWKVYKRSGDAKALAEAAKVGRFRGFFLGVPASHGELPPVDAGTGGKLLPPT